MNEFQWIKEITPHVFKKGVKYGIHVYDGLNLSDFIPKLQEINIKYPRVFNRRANKEISIIKINWYNNPMLRDALNYLLMSNTSDYVYLTIEVRTDDIGSYISCGWVYSTISAYADVDIILTPEEFKQIGIY